ncbi:MAG: pitrilysin family protein [Candidatus Neomarinimicrobiota bacterium]
MIKRFKIILLLALIFTYSCTLKNETDSNKFSVGGLTVILKIIPESDIVSLGYYINGGSAYLSPQQAGLERLLLAVSPKGTENFDKETLQGQLEAMGSQIFSKAGTDYSSLNLKCLADKFQDSWNIFQDIILYPLLDSTEIELEKATQLAIIRSERDQPEDYLNKLSREFYFKGHPYALSSLGLERTVKEFSRIDLVKYHENNFTKSRGLLIVVGGITKQEILDLAQKLAKELPRGKKYKENLPDKWVKTASSMLTIESKSPMPTNYLIGAANAPNLLSPDYYAFQLAIQKLNTRVFEEVRTKRNLSYAPRAGYRRGRISVNYLYVTTTQPDTVIGIMFNELDRLKENLITAKELKELQMMNLTKYYMNGETTGAQQSILADY